MLAVRLCKKEKCGTGKKTDETYVYMEQNVESKIMNTIM